MNIKGVPPNLLLPILSFRHLKCIYRPDTRLDYITYLTRFQSIAGVTQNPMVVSYPLLQCTTSSSIALAVITASNIILWYHPIMNQSGVISSHPLCLIAVLAALAFSRIFIKVCPSKTNACQAQWKRKLAESLSLVQPKLCSSLLSKASH